jgi:hypothetical protein
VRLAKVLCRQHLGERGCAYDARCLRAGTIGVFKRDSQAAKVWDNKRVVIIPDHYIFTADRRNRNVDILRDFARAGVALFST